MVTQSRLQVFLSALAVAGWLVVPKPASALIVGGGGSPSDDCVAVLDAPANSPAPPKPAKNVDCVDGDPACDGDGARNGQCVFALKVCVNSTALPSCTPVETTGVSVDHALDDGEDPKFDPDYQALQQRVDLLGFPNADTDSCTTSSSVTVKLRPPSSGNVYKKTKKLLSLTAAGATAGGSLSDRDKLKLTCRPEGSGVYLPTDLYSGTFDRIRQTVFAQSCALATCHDSESSQGALILLPNVAYSQTVGVTPLNPFAAADGLQRIFPGDTTKSFLYRKVTKSLALGYGSGMPLNRPSLTADQIELIRLWILGDMTLGPAPETGWVQGTDQ
jgi:hypothetical protein